MKQCPSSLVPGGQLLSESITCTLKWRQFAHTHKFHPSSPSLSRVADFLTHLISEGASYNTINSARSALSAFLAPLQSGQTIGNHLDIVRLVKRCFFQIRPALPRYTETWDINIVLDYLAALPSSDQLDLKRLTLRTTMLSTLLTC